MDLPEILAIMIGLLLGITVHEAAHAYTAFRLGDRTAFGGGRITLNPLKHIDPLGTIILPLVLLLSHAPFLFGYARPVPVQPRFFRDPRRGMALVAAAGPAANLALALVCALSGAALPMAESTLWLRGALEVIFTTNVVLAFFNILPIPPLDGSKVLAGFLPDRAAKSFLRLGRYRYLPLLLIFVGVPLTAWLIATVLRLR